MYIVLYIVHVSLVCHTRQGNGLFHELVKFLSMSLMSSSVYTATANKTLLSSNAAVDKLFNILTNCTMTQECRTIFKKVCCRNNELLNQHFLFFFVDKFFVMFSFVSSKIETKQTFYDKQLID